MLECVCLRVRASVNLFGPTDMCHRYNTRTRALSYNIVHSIPGSRVSAAHIHMGSPTATLAQSKLVYTFPAGYSPIRGQVILDRTMAEALYLGNLYVNIHTSSNPGGELRGKRCSLLYV